MTSKRMPTEKKALVATLDLTSVKSDEAASAWLWMTARMTA
jgi:hypothetical protein